MGIGVAQIAEGWADESSARSRSCVPTDSAASTAMAEVECAAQVLVEALGAFDDGTEPEVLELVVPLLRRHLDAAEVREARVSLDNARLLCEVAGLSAYAAAEAHLLEAARQQTPGRLRHTIDRWLAGIPAEPDHEQSRAHDGDDDDIDDEIPTAESELERRRRLAFARRAVRMVPVGGGLTRIDAVLPTDTAHAVMARLAELAGLSGDDASGRSWPQRLADALVEMAGVDGLAWSLSGTPHRRSRPRRRDRDGPRCASLPHPSPLAAPHRCPSRRRPRRSHVGRDPRG